MADLIDGNRTIAERMERLRCVGTAPAKASATAQRLETADRLLTFGRARVLDEDKGIVESVISSGDVARDNAIIEVAGWELGNYNRNPVVLWGHNDTTLPIARTVKITKTRNALIGTCEFDMGDDFARSILRKVKDGFVNATSVRWLPLASETRIIDGKEVLVFTRQELLEWSFVSIPADPKALIMRSLTQPLDPTAYRREVREQRSRGLLLDLRRHKVSALHTQFDVELSVLPCQQRYEQVRLATGVRFVVDTGSAETIVRNPAQLGLQFSPGLFSRVYGIGGHDVPTMPLVNLHLIAGTRLLTVPLAKAIETKDKHEAGLIGVDLIRELHIRAESAEVLLAPQRRPDVCDCDTFAAKALGREVRHV